MFPSVCKDLRVSDAEQAGLDYCIFIGAVMETVFLQLNSQFRHQTCSWRRTPPEPLVLLVLYWFMDASAGLRYLQVHLYLKLIVGG